MGSTPAKTDRNVGLTINREDAGLWHQCILAHVVSNRTSTAFGPLGVGVILKFTRSPCASAFDSLRELAGTNISFSPLPAMKPNPRSELYHLTVPFTLGPMSLGVLLRGRIADVAAPRNSARIAISLLRTSSLCSKVASKLRRACFSLSSDSRSQGAQR